MSEPTEAQRSAMRVYLTANHIRPTPVLVDALIRLFARLEDTP